MIITCDECDSSFVLDDSLLKPGGSKVRCSSCGNIFIAKPGDPEAPPPVKRAVPKAKSIRPKKKTETPVAIPPVAPSENDPELTKAVEQIIEDELIFTDNELFDGEPAPQVVEKPAVEEVDEIPQIEVDDNVAEEEIAEEDDEILDFSDFELDMEEDNLPAGGAGLDADDELNLDLDIDRPAEETAVEDGDLDLQMEDEEDLYSDDDDLDFSDLEAELDGTPQEASADIGSDEDILSSDDDLDFSDLDLELDEDIEEASPEKISNDDGLDLQLDDDLEMGTVESLDIDLDGSSDDPETMMIEDEFDFSDLEAELDGDLGEISDNEPPELEDLELDLELDSEDPETLNIGNEDLDLSDFELDLEEDSDDSIDAPPEIPDADLELDLDLTDDDDAVDEELDFSDLAGMLEDEPSQDTSSDDGDSLELDLDLELDDDLDMDTPDDQQEVQQGDADEELDFSDLENILDDVDATDTSLNDGPDEDIELELDMDMDGGSELDLTSDDSDDLDDGSFDFSDVEAMLEADDNLDDGEDLELDLDSSTDDDLAGIDFDDNGDIDLELSINDDEEDDLDEDEIDDIDEESGKETVTKEKQKKVKPKRKANGGGKLISKLIITIIILLILVLGVFLSSGQIDKFTGYMLPEIPQIEMVREKIIEANLPFISDWVKIVEKDPKGVLGLKTSNITGGYFTNDISGNIFVIRGNVKNTYPGTRNSISLKCNLINAAGKITKSEFVYAGNTINDEKLKTLDFPAIRKLLKKRLGTNNNNAKVRPGQMLPFAVVFADLKEEFTEFSVEPEGSHQGAAIK